MFEDMTFGMCTSYDRSLDVARTWWREMAQAGFDYIGVPDTPMLCREAYLSLAIAAQDNPRTNLMLMVSNVITRDVTVTAGSILTLREFAGDRFIYGFGIGDSAVMGVGLKKSNIADIEDYIRTLRQILAGGEGVYKDRRLKAAWQELEPFRPRLMAGVGGQKNLRASGRFADVVITTYGSSPDRYRRAVELIHEGAAEAGRDPSEIEIWQLMMVMVGDTLQEGFTNINLLTQAKMFALHGDRGVGRPPNVQEALRQIAPLYSIDRHSRTNEEIWDIAQKTGTVEYFVEQVGGMVGPADYTSIVQNLREAGARNIMFVSVGSPRKSEAIARVAAATVQKRTVAAR